MNRRNFVSLLALGAIPLDAAANLVRRVDVNTAPRVVSPAASGGHTPGVAVPWELKTAQAAAWQSEGRVG
jgi:hypothetical protein